MRRGIGQAGAEEEEAPPEDTSLEGQAKEAVNETVETAKKEVEKVIDKAADAAGDELKKLPGGL